MKVKSQSEVIQSCLTLHNPMDCSLPGSSIHGIFQARGLEWGAIAFPTSTPGLRTGFYLHRCTEQLLFSAESPLYCVTLHSAILPYPSLPIPLALSFAMQCVTLCYCVTTLYHTVLHFELPEDRGHVLLSTACLTSIRMPGTH